jgi:hypothetical protein
MAMQSANPPFAFAGRKDTRLEAKLFAQFHLDSTQGSGTRPAGLKAVSIVITF